MPLNNECRRHDTYYNVACELSLFNMDRTYGSSTRFCFNFQRIKIRCYNMVRSYASYDLNLSNAPN
ncbi:MAG: hypothetical protein JWQ34_3460 [Mucilaginibacter sp.]|nr:hypothetical protein [Mucilaginibacter sp.]